jgi:glycosyltransferase involved in cell wall biosynthesis
MRKISAVIITLNEEKNIGRCLDSVNAVADEVLVVDSFSTDKTEEICINKGAKFVQNEFIDYLSQHIFADQLAENDFILTLDADEALSEELQQSIIKVKENGNSDGYILNRLTNYCGKWIKHSGWYPDYNLRLYDKTKGKWAGKYVHEKFEINPGSTTEKLKGDIHHYSYYSIEEHILQANKFSTLGSKALIDKNKKVNFLMLLIKPIAKFIRNYILRLGFLDGFYGFVICQITANETYLKYLKTYHHYRLKRKENL